MKTPTQIVNELPKHISERFWKNWERLHTKESLNVVFSNDTTIKHIIVNSFNWEKTHEGKCFWWLVYFDVRDKEQLNKYIEK